MKKLILISFLLIVGTIAYSQSDSISLQPKSETERLIDKYLEKAEVAVTSLASTLKVPAEHVYSVLVRQQKVIAISEIVGTGIITLIFCISLTIGVYTKWEFEPLVAITVISGFATLIFLVIVIAQGIPKLLNPEYGAIQEIMSFFK